MKGAWEQGRDPLEALRRGDPRLFEDFVRTEVATLVGFFRRMGADRDEAEDLTQEVLIKLFKSADSYRRQGTFASYALRIARNAWVDRRRRAAVIPMASAPRDAAIAAAEPEASCALSLREEAERLRAAMTALPRTHAEVLELAVVQGLPYADIASALGIPIGTVKSRVFNAVRKLRVALDQEAQPGEEGVA